ncbi:MAG: hypothetical protein GC192_22985 [Bacteroidetes bacterium]|nr:hypothetical protein [Bacteroidota bacterium]
MPKVGSKDSGKCAWQDVLGDCGDVGVGYTVAANATLPSQKAGAASIACHSCSATGGQVRERRRCLACCGRLSGRQGGGGAVGVSLAAPLKTGGRGC